MITKQINENRNVPAGCAAESTGFFENLRSSLDSTVGHFNRMAPPLSAAYLRGYDIFHTTFFPVPAHLRVQRRVSMITTVHDLIPLVLRDMFIRGKNTGDIQRVVSTLKSLTLEDHVLCISEATRNDLLQHAQVDPEKVHVVPNAADPEIFYPCTDPVRVAASRSRYGIPEGPYILSICTLEPRKNLVHLIRCFSQLIRDEHIPDLRLVLVGAKGWGYEPIFDEMRRTGLSEDRIIITGYVADEDLAPLYSAALVFVYPSLYEGFGLPPLEAMQCGTPVITSNTSSLPEVVGEAGLMVDPNDTDALCEAMLRLYRDSDFRADLSQRSLERAKLFSWERTVEQTVAVYRKAVG